MQQPHPGVRRAQWIHELPVLAVYGTWFDQRRVRGLLEARAGRSVERERH